MTITPFSNGTEFMHWYENNCGLCTKANSEATERKDTCPMEYDIALGAASSGEIPIESAERIGYKKEPCFVLLGCKEKTSLE